MKQYDAIFFDWDGTAVLSRRDPGEVVAPLMAELLEKGVVLAIISGTTYENVAGGELHKKLPAGALRNLYLGLGRGAFHYGFDQNGQPEQMESRLPDRETLCGIHDACYELHRELLAEAGYETDLVFSRPGYCKLDLLPGHNRMERCFSQPGELALLEKELERHGIRGGLRGLMERLAGLGSRRGIPLRVTTDAKYLEAGLTTKSTNVDVLLRRVVFKRGISVERCCYWGDEFSSFGDGIPGSDSFMITALSGQGDFFDVSPEGTGLPPRVEHRPGGVGRFHEFLREQAGLFPEIKS